MIRNMIRNRNRKDFRVIIDYIEYKRFNMNGDLNFPKEILLEFKTKNCGFATCNKTIDNEILVSKILPLKKKVILIQFEIPFEITDHKLLSFLKSFLINYDTNWFRIFVHITSKNLITISISTENENNFEFINEMYKDDNYIRLIKKQAINYYLKQKIDFYET